MPRKHDLMISGSSNMSGTTKIRAVRQIQGMEMGSFQALWNGTPNGTFKVYGSNAFDPGGGDTGADLAAQITTSFSYFGLTNGKWEDLTSLFTVVGTGSPIGAAGSSTFMLFDAVMCFEWLCFEYTNASGTGSLVVHWHAKGPS